MSRACARSGARRSPSSPRRDGLPGEAEQAERLLDSKDDGVVRWQAQLLPYADCVEVTGSHVGLIVNRQSYRVIAHALAAREP